MKKYRIQPYLTWICFRCGKKIEKGSDLAVYNHRIYHNKCAPTLLERIKRKIFGGKR